MSRKKKDNRLFWAADCETDPFKYQRLPKPFIWGCYTGTSYHDFHTVEEFVEFIRDNEVIIYFHNGGKFDVHFLLEHINLAEEVKVINGRLVVCKIGKAELRDSWNILPTKLENLGGKLSIDYEKMEAKVRKRHMKEIREYLKMDCVSLWQAIEVMERDYGRHMTIAGASLDHWRKISGMNAPKTDKGFFEKFVKYYYGGRVQPFERGVLEGPFKYFDIRSAYGWAQLFEHPYEPEYVTIKNPSKIEPTSMVTLDCVSMGALPWRNEKGSILFPDDDIKRTYYVPGHEVIAAQETGALRDVSIHEAIDFTQKVSFAPYINHHYDKRKIARAQGLVAETEIEKMFITNLYGKWCANPENYGNYMCVKFSEMCNYVEDGYLFDGMIGPHALLRAPLDPWQENYLNVATGASITSQVRAHLWRAISACERPIYCDTDSLICREADLPIGEDLGQWNLEGTIETAWIAGKKTYYLEGEFEKGKKTKSATKGVNLRMSEIRKHAELATGPHGRVIVGGDKIEGGEAVKLAAQGETVVFGSAAPTYSIKKPPIFQTRRVKATV